MKKIILAVSFLPLLTMAQTTVSVKEAVVAIDGMSRNSLTVMIKDASTDDVKKAWKKQLKDLKGKVSDKTIIFADDCEDKSMGDNTFDVYSVVEEATDEGVKLVVAFDLGGAYLSTTDHPEKFPAAEKIVKNFAIEQAKEAVRIEIDVAEKILKGFEKDLSGLEKDKKKLEKDIEDYEKKIEEAKAEIEKNVADQTNKKTEIEGLKASMVDLEQNKVYQIGPLKRFCLIVLFLALTCGVSAQQKELASPYNFNWKKDLIYASGAGLVAAGGILTRLQTRPFTEAQVNALNKYNVPGFDRPATEKWNPDAALASDILLYSSMTLPAFMMINKRMRKDFLVIGFIYAETAMLTLGVTELTKGLSKRARPFAYNNDVSMSRKLERDARLSFFSGHTSITTALCFTTAKIFSDYSDNPTHEALVWTAAATVPIATAFLRYEAGKHFPSDVIGGYIIGGAIGYLVPWLHRRKPITKGITLSPFSTGDGLGVYFSYTL